MLKCVCEYIWEYEKIVRDRSIFIPGGGRGGGGGKGDQTILVVS